MIALMGIVDPAEVEQLRMSEITELYMYLFILFFLIVFARRVDELEFGAGHPSRAAGGSPA